MNPNGTGPAVLLCEHASAHIPAPYGNLGLSASARKSHAVWDPGAVALAKRLSKGLDAPLVAGRVSRLVIDCNRPPDAASAIPERSEQIEVPGNRKLSEAERARRVDTVYRPFCAAVDGVLEARRMRGQPTALITVHSFAPLWFGKARPVEIGILHDSDARLADAILARCEAPRPHRFERNAPYGPEDGVTHSLKIHGIANGLENVMIEVRSDLLASAAQQGEIAKELLSVLRPALQDVGVAAAGELQHA